MCGLVQQAVCLYAYVYKVVGSAQDQSCEAESSAALRSKYGRGAFSFTQPFLICKFRPGSFDKRSLLTDFETNVWDASCVV